MSIDLSGFDASQIEPDKGGDYSPLPVDWYKVVITAGTMKDNSPQAGDPTGQQMELEMQVVEGDYEGRKLWENLNLVNKSQQAVEIAQKQLSSYCHAVGVLQPQTEADLIGLPFMVKLDLEPAKKANQKPRNKITARKSIDEFMRTAQGNAASGALATTQAAPSTAQPASNGPSFGKPAATAAPSGTVGGGKPGPSWAK